MATQIIRAGEVIAVEIPEDLLRQANLSVGDPVEWTMSPDGELALRAPDVTQNVSEPEEGYEEWKTRQMEAGFAEIEAGHFVEGERVKEWLRSWGTDQELPPPR
jgi:antitoxin component of MazEF toxin-antitoxin module